jgi:subfamily B ATP-binding cassette protein MsbA
MICTLVVGATGGATAWLVKPVLDDVFINSNEKLLWLLPLGLLALYAAKGCGRYLQSVLMTQAGELVVLQIRNDLMRRIQYREMGFFDRNSTGILLAKIVNDVSAMQRAIPSAIMFIRQVINGVGLITVLFMRNWMLAIVAMFVFPLSAYFMRKIGIRLREYAAGMMASGALVHDVIVESFSGIEVVKTFGCEESEIKRFSDSNKMLYGIIMRITRLRNVTSPLMEFLGAMASALIIWYGGSEVIKGNTTPGEFFSFLTALFMLYEPVKTIGNLNNDIHIALASADRVFKVMDEPVAEGETSGDKVMDSVIESVEFENVHFSYDINREKVLNGIDLSTEVGQITALVGESGSGKSTILKLLPRLYTPNEGSVKVNGINIAEYTVKSLRANIAVVTQNTYLFDDTVFNNILVGRPDASRDEVIAAAKSAYAHDFIMDMPSEYETRVGQRGDLFSGGQKQRIAIARAILKDAPILVLDEATSSLDSEVEKEIQEALNGLMVGRTTFVIAHRLSTVRHANQILFIQNGAIAERGHNDELYSKNGGYARLCDLQFGPSGAVSNLA